MVVLVLFGSWILSEVLVIIQPLLLLLLDKVKS